MKIPKWLKILIVIAVLIIIISSILRIITPQPTILPTPTITSENIDDSTSDFKNLIFTGQTISIPKQLKFGSAKISEFVDSTYFSNFMTKYSLQPHPKLTTMWLNGDTSLTQDKISGELNLTFNQVDQQNPIVNSDQAITTAQKNIQEFFPNLQLGVHQPGITYFSGNTQLIQSSLDKATFVEIPFNYYLDEIPIFINQQIKSPISVMINGNNQIVRITIQPQIIEFKTEGEVKTIDLERALININNNQASIISAYFTDLIAEEISIDTIKSGELKTVQLEYRVDDQSGLIYPFYRFTGQVVNANDRLMDVEIITPAVEVKKS